MEVSAFLTEQLKTQMCEQRAHDKAQHAEVVRLLEGQLEVHRQELATQHKQLEEHREQALEAKLREGHRQELEKQHKELEEYREHVVEAKLREQSLQVQVVGLLQTRLEALHSAKLLDDEEVYTIEDIIADSETGDIRVSQLIALSDRMKSDKTFARQLRRKYC